MNFNFDLLDFVYVLSGTFLGLVATAAVWKTRTDDKLLQDDLRLRGLERAKQEFWKEINGLTEKLSKHEKECAEQSGKVTAKLENIESMLERVLDKGCDPAQETAKRLKVDRKRKI